MSNRGILSIQVTVLMILCSVLALSNFCSAISPEETMSAEEYFQHGLTDYEAGNYKSAMESFSEALFLDPTNKQARHYLEKAGEKFLEEKESEKESERKDMLQRAKSEILERRKKAQENYENGVKHYRRSELLKAIEEFNSVLEIEPEHKEAKGYLELIVKKLEDAVNKGEFKTVSELYYAQGAIFYVNGEWAKAIGQWEEAIKLDPANEELSEFIKIASKKKEEQEALEKAEVLHREGVAHYNEGRFEEAIGELEEAVKLNPKHIKAREYLAKAKDKLATIKKEEEERKHREAIETHYFQGIDYYAEGEFGKAISEWEEVLLIDPEHKGAKEYMEKAREKIASVTTERRKAEIPLRTPEEEKIEIYYRQGINYYLAGDYRKAIEQWQEVLRMDPSHKGAREYMAKAKGRLKVSEEGIGYSPYEEEIEQYVKELEKGGTTDKEKEELIATHYQDGLVAYAHGDLSQAMKEWQIVLKLDPEHKKARRALIKLQAELERRRGKEE